jgi:tRNA modification GTPase
MDDQPIVALCTPQGSGALALIRISGTGAVALVDAFARLSSGKRLVDLSTHTIHHGHLIDNEQIIDEVLFFLMRAPRTFTGQDTVEISCHNNRFIIQKIINAAVLHGAHHAQRGEFTRRAVLNKKIDLLQAEAIHDLIAAQNEIALQKSMAQLKGTLSHHVHEIEQELIKLLSMVEASFEFLDEEQRDLDFDALITKALEETIKKIETILANFSQQQHIRQGVRIALIGGTNVGKSTLFNALVKQERAIVTDIPGTTRDAIETTRYIDGNFWLLIDTAGLRDTKDKIEQIGIDRSWQEAAQSDIILLILDATKQMTDQEALLHKRIKETYPEKVIVVANKIDKINDTKDLDAEVFISAEHKIGLDKLEELVKKRLDSLFTNAKAPYLLNQRHYDLLLEVLVALKMLKTETIHHEIMAYNIKELLELVSQLMGRTVNEKVMERVFDSFCIGK